MDARTGRLFVAGMVGVAKAMEAGAGVRADQFRGGRALQKESLHGTRTIKGCGGGEKSKKRKKRKRRKRDRDGVVDVTLKSLGVLSATEVQTAISGQIQPQLLSLVYPAGDWQRNEDGEPRRVEVHYEGLYETYAILTRGYGSDERYYRVPYTVSGTTVAVGTVQEVKRVYVPIGGDSPTQA